MVWRRPLADTDNELNQSILHYFVYPRSNYKNLSLEEAILRGFGKQIRLLHRHNVNNGGPYHSANRCNYPGDCNAVSDFPYWARVAARKIREQFARDFFIIYTFSAVGVQHWCAAAFVYLHIRDFGRLVFC
jgi:hypothetical protein